MVVCCIPPRPTYKRVPTLTNLYVLEPLLPPFPRPHIIDHRISYLLSISCTITFASTTAGHVVSQSFGHHVDVDHSILPHPILQVLRTR
jgi:hypothetical protein